MEHPLADRIRPQSLDEVVGQKHLLGGNALLRRFIEKGTDANMVFYGPSGPPPFPGRSRCSGQSGRPPA